MSWEMSGTYVESCNCETACPCVFLSPPTEDDCTLLVGWHIDQGHLDDVVLDGLNVSLAVQVDGHMMENKWNAALYLDDTADDQQMDALGRIFGGQLGGVPAALGEHIGAILGAGPAPIAFEADGSEVTLTIGEIASMKVSAMSGQNGGPVEIVGQPLAIAPGNPGVVGRSEYLRYTDHGMSWQLTGKNSFSSPFQYSG